MNAQSHATWNSAVNRPQVKDAANIMSELVPMIIHIMLDNPKAFPGKPSYPLVGKFNPNIEK